MQGFKRHDGTQNNRVEIQKHLLQKLYIDWNLPTRKIAEMLNCTPAIVRHKLHEYNIPTCNNDG